MSALAAATAGLDPGTLERFLAPQRWFDAKGRALRDVRVRDLVPLGDGDRLGIARIVATFADGGRGTYQLPLVIAAGDAPPPGVVARTAQGTLVDGVFDAAFRRRLGRAVAEGACIETAEARWRVTPIGHLVPPTGDGRLMGVEQSNTSIVYDDAVVVKLVRKLEPGVNPDVEIGAFLARHTDFRHVPALLATLTFEDPGSEDTVAGMAQQFVPSVGDGWAWALERLRAWLAEPGDAPDDFPAAATALGRVTRGLHEALASRADVAAFAPEPVTAEQARSWTAAVGAGVERALDRLAEARLAGDLDDAGALLVARRGEAKAAVGRLGATLESEGGMRIRHHGDYHLGQVLRTRDDDFVVIDFEGEPARPLEERRAKHSPLRDVAGMLRSFDYAAATAATSAPARGAAWVGRARDAFLAGYLDLEPAPALAILPRGRAALRAITFFELEKVFYELAYELGNRPDWVGIPLAGATRLLDALAGEP